MTPRSLSLSFAALSASTPLEHRKILILFVVVTLAGSAACFSSGAPPLTCSTQFPLHFASPQSPELPSPFVIEAFQDFENQPRNGNNNDNVDDDDDNNDADIDDNNRVKRQMIATSFIVRIRPNNNNNNISTFRGFSVQARSVDNSEQIIEGEFVLTDPAQRHLSTIFACGSSGHPNTWTHNSNREKSMVEARYQILDTDFSGRMRFVATIVVTRSLFWVGQLSDVFVVNGNSENGEVPQIVGKVMQSQPVPSRFQSWFGAIPGVSRIENWFSG